jgi:branched-subunit amino acid transport protein
MNDAYVWAVVVGMGAANYVLRATPFVALSKVRLPDWAQRWLSFIPVSVMAALVAGEVVRPGGAWIVPWHNAYLLAAFGTALVYMRFRSLMGATLAGLALFLVLRWALGFVPF